MKHVGIERHGSPDQWDALLSALSDLNEAERALTQASLSMAKDTQLALKEWSDVG